MRRIRLKSLRSALFLLLALLFAILALLEAIPKVQTEDFVQVDPFRVVASPNGEGGYTYRIEGSIKNQSGQRKFLDGVVVSVMDRDGDSYSLELAVGNIAAGEVRKLSGQLTAKAPASKLLGISTSVLAGDQPIPIPNNGFQITTGTITFGALSFVSLVFSFVFFLRRMRRHHNKADNA